MAQRKSGRKRGSRQRGYYFRKGRGWYALRDGRSIPLTLDGKPIRDKDTNPEALRQAHQRLLDELAAPLPARARPGPVGAITVGDVCNVYLNHASATGAATTHYNRANSLWDFCTALPAKYRPKPGVAQPRLTPADRCPHPAFGRLPAGELTALHVDQWLDAHPAWKDRRFKVQALKRAYNYAVDGGLLTVNPIAKYPVGRSRGRVTYFTPEQEAALLAAAGSALTAAMRVLVRTGLRYGIEFTTMTAASVADGGDRMEWRVTPKQTPASAKYRTVWVTDPAVVELTRRQVERYPTGALWRNHHGDAWTAKALSGAFTRLMARVQRKGVTLDADACIYSFRHTYAKRTLEGFWTGRPTTIETLARLMGNTPQVCWNHYVQWSPTHNKALWEAC
jgi:integrase